MHDFPWMWIFFGMFFWMFMLRPRRAWARCGRSSGDEMRDSIDGSMRDPIDRPMRDPLDRPRRRGHRAHLGSELAERDALIAKLEERVRVLERIATDDSARLRAEIDSLNDPPPPASAQKEEIAAARSTRGGVALKTREREIPARAFDETASRAIGLARGEGARAHGRSGRRSTTPAARGRWIGSPQ